MAASKVAANAHRGEVPIEIAGKLEFASINYERAAQLIALFSEGRDATTCNFGSGAFEAWLAGDLDKISAALAILTGLEVEDIYKASPPWERSIRTIEACYNLFYFGTAEAPAQEEEADEAQSPLGNRTRMANFLSWLGKKRSERASSPANSGPPPSTKSPSGYEHGASTS